MEAHCWNVHLGKIIAVRGEADGAENFGGNANVVEVLFEDTQERRQVVKVRFGVADHLCKGPRRDG